MENIRVIIRFRPINRKDEENKDCINIDCNSGLINIENRKFIFDNVFNENFSQKDIFEKIKNVIDWVIQGYNATIFTYGPTGSGKTFTMFGDDLNPGIIPRVSKLIFEKLNESKENIENNVKCSFIEIYKEQLKDLLDKEKTSNIKLRHDIVNGVFIQGVIEQFVYSSKQILEIIKDGALQRATASTSLNNTSSRSHSVLTITIFQKLIDGSELNSKLHLVDLAGSENVGKSEVTGNNLEEAKMINKSLSCLGNVIYSITENSNHIPYRDSKLTFFLQDSIGGNSKTILIATASPSISTSSETLNTLRFAQRVKEIKNIPKINKHETSLNLLKTIKELEDKLSQYENGNNIIIDNTKIKKYEEENNILKEEINFLKEKNKKLELNFENQKQYLENLFEKNISLQKEIIDLKYYKNFHEIILNTKDENLSFIKNNFNK